MDNFLQVREDQISIGEWFRELRIWWLGKRANLALRRLRAMEWARHRCAAERLKMMRRPAMIACLNEWNNVRGCR